MSRNPYDRRIQLLILSFSLTLVFTINNLYATDEFPEITDRSLNEQGIAYSVGSNLILGPSGKSVWVAPVATIFEEQVPIYFAFRSDKPDLIKKYRLYERTPENLMIEVTVEPLDSGQTVKWEWGVYSLHLSKDYSKCPSNSPILSPDSYPVEVREWLKPSKSVQSDHPEIKAKANELKGTSSDTLEVAQNVYNFMQGWRTGRPNSCDALETLRKGGGSCTNHAQLSAALLRASGIPARVLANYPTWYRGSLATHYDVEFYVPGFGWYWMDTIARKKPLEPYKQVVFPVNIEDEDKGMNPNRYGVALGVPYYSIRERIEGTAGGGGGLPSGGFATAGGVTTFTGDLTDASELTKSMWRKCLKLEIEGKIKPEAKEYQLKAAKSKNLADYIANIKKADEMCSDGTPTTTTTPVTTTTTIPPTTSKILLAISSNRCHAWHYRWNYNLYEPYLLTPLKAKLGNRLITCHHNCTPANIKKIITEQNPALFVWIGGGLNDHMECDAGEGIGVDCTSCRDELGLSDRIAFINCEYSNNVNQKLTGSKVAFGYWTEMSSSLHPVKYNCDYFSNEPQPIDWYAPYFILMRHVIEQLAECHTVEEAANDADALYAGFLDWVNDHPEVPYHDDYLRLSHLWSSLSNNIYGDSDARITGCMPTSTTCPYDSDFRFVLKKALLDYLRDPSRSKLKPSEVRTLLDFYLQTPDLSIADCSAINPIIGKVDIQIPDDILLITPYHIHCSTCSDGTVCSQINAYDQTCDCLDLDKDSVYEYCVLRPIVKIK